jgi:hypothetical protein
MARHGVLRFEHRHCWRPRLPAMCECRRELCGRNRSSA